MAFDFFSDLAYHSDILLELCLLLVCITLAKSGFNAVKTCLGVRRFKRKTWKHRLAALKHGNSIAHGSWICVAKNVCNTGEERTGRAKEEEGGSIKKALRREEGMAIDFFSDLAYHSDILLELLLLLVCITLAKSGFNAVKTCLGVRRFKRKTWKHRLAALKHGNSIPNDNYGTKCLQHSKAFTDVKTEEERIGRAKEEEGATNNQWLVDVCSPTELHHIHFPITKKIDWAEWLEGVCHLQTTVLHREESFAGNRQCQVLSTLQSENHVAAGTPNIRTKGAGVCLHIAFWSVCSLMALAPQRM